MSKKLRKFQRPPEPREEHVNAGDVLAHLAELSKAASIREIAHGMGLKHRGRRFLPRVIQKLKKAGDIEEIYGGRYKLADQKTNQEPTQKPNPKETRAAASASSARAEDATSGQGSATDAQSAAASRRARDPNLIAGRIIAHRDGYAFLVPDHPIPGVDGDLFIGRDSLGDAMHGDRVLGRIVRRRPDGRAEGRIVQIVRREHPTLVGLFRYGPHGNHVLPYDVRLHHEVLIPPGDELAPDLRAKLGLDAQPPPPASRRLRLPELDGAVVNVEITRFPRSGLAPTGRVIEILGRPGDIGVDVEIIIRKHHIPHEFPDDVIAAAKATPAQAGDNDLRGRRDFRDLPIVTIDGETARDFDDAVLVRPLPGGACELQVHIADVAHYVPRNSALDREARIRGTSVYFPNRAVPMLPEQLSNGICSLNPQVDRLVMSVIMQIDSAGRVIAADFTPGVIRSAERMTYTNVNKVIEGDAEMTLRYAPLAENFRRMKDLALLLNARRRERGSIDFDLPEPVIEFDDAGAMTSILRSERNIAHRLIEEFMLAANEAVARYLEKRGVASLHRVHEKPDPKKVLEFEELAQAFGYSLGVEDLTERRVTVRHGQSKPSARVGGGRGRMRPMHVDLPGSDEVDIRPQHYQRLTEKIAGKPEERILSYLMLRSLKQARYAADPLGHFALAAGEYTHFTSPIRRYPDLIVHRALKWALENPGAAAPRAPHPEPPRKSSARGGEPPSIATLGPYRRVELEEIASESSEAERGADMAERELIEWKKAQFMESHLGEEYDGLIISVQKFGFFVELTDIFIEGLVGIERLEESTGMRCEFRERDHSIVTEPHRGSRRGAPRNAAKLAFRLGDRVQVRAERIDPFRHRVEFAIV
ncbi:MAG TPA: VacB/RNase II family 3'-5' exoribonuclease [Candidatus Acidoferrales bacterium]|jgi:ribonuclease R|nr:VacB/RNase II family 3'-5' exoribonuclease [Candidatus Acidoferrales bacterium]